MPIELHKIQKSILCSLEGELQTQNSSSLALEINYLQLNHQKYGHLLQVTS